MIAGLLALLILGIITVAANYTLEEKSMFRWVAIAIMFLNSILLLLSALNVGIASMSKETREQLQMPDIDLTDAIATFVIFAITVVLTSALLTRRFRDQLTRFFPRRQAPSVRYSLDGVLYPANPNESAFRGYDPANPVHMVALIFAVYLVGSQFGSLVLQGGLSGVAQDVTITWPTLIANFLPQVIVPILGVGFMLRRTWPQICQRLGLTFNYPSRTEVLPTPIESLAMGFATAIAMLIVAAFLAGIWQALVSPETFERQTEASRAIADSIDTIWLALGVSLTAAIGEEVAFRGGFQPIFGFWATAILFTLSHIQYTLTPAALIIFVVALSLGLLRQYFNLYTAITAHFFYNFIPLAIATAMI